MHFRDAGRAVAVLALTLSLAAVTHSANAQLNADSQSYKASLVGSGLHLKYSTNGTSYQDLSTLTNNLFALDALANHGQGYYEVGFDAMPATIRLREDGLGLKAGQTADIREIASVTLFNLGEFSSYALGANVRNGQNTGVQLFSWTTDGNGQPLPMTGSWMTVTHTDSGQTKPFAIGYEDNTNALFSNKQDPSGASPLARYGDFQFTSWSRTAGVSTPTFIAMDVQLTNGNTGRIYLDGSDGSTTITGLVPEPAGLQLAALLALLALAASRTRRSAGPAAS